MHLPLEQLTCGFSLAEAYTSKSEEGAMKGPKAGTLAHGWASWAN